MSAFSGATAIAGYGETEYWTGTERDQLRLTLDAVMAAAADAGIDVTDIDGIVRYSIDGAANDQLLVSNLGLRDLGFSVEIPFYGGSACAAVSSAAAAVHAGLADAVLVYRAFSLLDMTEFAKRNSASVWAMQAGVADYMRPYGWLSMMDTYALTFESHAARYGTTTRQLGEIAVAIRENANRNPNALLHDVPLSLEDHETASLVSGRLTVDDVTLSDCEGAAAVIVTRATDAGSSDRPAVTIRAAAAGLGRDPSLNWEMHLFRDDPTVSPAAYAAPKLFAMADMAPADIDVAQMYDCATVNVLLQLEDYGFCAKGEGGSFVEDGNVALGGNLPITTSGGMLAEASNHGFNHVIEAVKQMRGESHSQVDDAATCLVTSSIPTPTSSLILARA